jgi:hypothetical protein
MSLAHNKPKLLKSLDFYLQFLKGVSAEDFEKSPAYGVWSLGQVYSHIIGANIMSHIALEKCLIKTADIKTRKPHWKVRLILFLGKFPPGKIKAPAAIAEAVKSYTKEEASNQLIRLIKKVNEYDYNSKTLDLNYKMKHPRLGYLDAASWFRFMLIHTNHHIKQVKNTYKAIS